MGNLSHLDELEAEAIYIIREVAAECENPCHTPCTKIINSCHFSFLLQVLKLLSDILFH